MTSLESQRPVRIAHMPVVQQWIDENSKGDEEGLRSTQKSSSIVFGVVLWQVTGQLWAMGKNQNREASSGVSSTDHLMHKGK